MKHIRATLPLADPHQQNTLSEFMRLLPLPTILLIWPMCFFTAETSAQENLVRQEKELAAYMGELQRITHKLSLSVHHNNLALTRFYMHESLHTLTQIQQDVPEYEGLPVALYIDRFSLSEYEDMKKALTMAEPEKRQEHLHIALEKIIESCNHCHRVTKFPFITIKHVTTNPFNQEFTPQD